MDIRELATADMAAATELWNRCGLTRPWNEPKADFDRAVTSPSSAVLGLIHEGALVGTVMVGMDGHRGWVYYLAVDEARRGEGIGRRLMEAAEQWLAEAGAPKIQLMVRRSNAEVIRFYERLGYADQEVALLGRFLDPELEQARRAAHS